MKLEGIESWRARIPLSRPYEIAYERVDSIELFFVRVRCAGQIGLGCASPLPEVTGESFAACGAALEPGALAELGDANLDDFPALLARIENSHRDTPAARAALDMALHDLRSRLADRPLVEMLGRVHSELATSITIGLKDSVAEVLAEAEEYVGRGFRLIKLKTGRELTQDIERMRRLRERFGASIRLRIDANVGCKPSELAALFSVADELDVELVEQPLVRSEDAALATLSRHGRGKLALDESMLDERDAIRLSVPAPICGIFNVKLMKCGGIAPAMNIGRIAERAGIDLMWGCSDESCIGIAAALHAAFACRATRFLDLDGHLDLARDPARGGFTIQDGVMRLTGKPGLGVELEPPT